MGALPPPGTVKQGFQGVSRPQRLLSPPRQIPDYAPETKLHNTERQNFMMIRI